jgi:hypothetical protein
MTYHLFKIKKEKPKVLLNYRNKKLPRLNFIIKISIISKGKDRKKKNGIHTIWQTTIDITYTRYWTKDIYRVGSTIRQVRRSSKAPKDS